MPTRQSLLKILRCSLNFWPGKIVVRHLPIRVVSFSNRRFLWPPRAFSAHLESREFGSIHLPLGRHLQTLLFGSGNHLYTVLSRSIFSFYFTCFIWVSCSHPSSFLFLPLFLSRFSKANDSVLMHHSNAIELMSKLKERYALFDLIISY